MDSMGLILFMSIVCLLLMSQRQFSTMTQYWFHNSILFYFASSVTRLKLYNKCWCAGVQFAMEMVKEEEPLLFRATEKQERPDFSNDFIKLKNVDWLSIRT